MGTLYGRFFVFVLVAIALLGCEADYHAREISKSTTEKRLTLGTVQREIKKGMSAAAVVEALGSPNVVTTDEQGREVWVYDKLATDIVTSSGGWFVTAGAASKSQRTLTIIIKYDEQKLVRDFAYHASRF